MRRASRLGERTTTIPKRKRLILTAALLGCVAWIVPTAWALAQAAYYHVPVQVINAWGELGIRPPTDIFAAYDSLSRTSIVKISDKHDSWTFVWRAPSGGRPVLYGDWGLDEERAIVVLLSHWVDSRLTYEEQGRLVAVGSKDAFVVEHDPDYNALRLLEMLVGGAWPAETRRPYSPSACDLIRE